MRGLVVLLFLFFSQQGIAAKITEQSALDIFLIGPIEAQDADRFRKIATPKRWLWINSPGGDVKAAMEIGRIVRANEMVVYVGKGSTCASACVLMLAAGTSRVVDPKADVVIHRPYLSKELVNESGYDRYYKKMVEDVKAYLGDMNISAALADRMMSIPPHRGLRLSQSDLSNYMLSGDDPAHEQKEAVAEARGRGISLVELNRRKAVVEEVCVWPPHPPEEEPFFDFAGIFCNDAILGGASAKDVLGRIHAAISKKSVIVQLNKEAQLFCLSRIIGNDKNASCPLDL